MYLCNINVVYLHLLTLLELEATERLIKFSEDTLLEMCTAYVHYVRGCVVTLKRCIQDMGVLLDNTMLMMNQLRCVCQVAYCHLNSITLIRRCLTTNACKTIVKVLIMQRERERDAAAEVEDGPEFCSMSLITGTKRQDYVTPVLYHLLPVDCIQIATTRLSRPYILIIAHDTLHVDQTKIY